MTRATTRVTGSLPVELTSFVGRHSQVASAKKVLESTRLLTLTGPGGVGKSRLGNRVAAEVHRAFRHGVWQVDLAEINDSKLLPLVIGTALGLHDVSADPGSRLAEFLQDRQLLLVLDNCEHLAEPVALLLKALLTTAPELRVLVTSRHVLGVEGEWVVSVPPLSVPPSEPRSNRAPAESFEAVKLFLERTEAALPGFSLSEDNLDPIVRICRRVDGIPLAIELAAARLRAYSLQQIACRLEQTLQLLRTGPRSAPVRHQTLHDTLNWSYTLCSPTEQVLWARLSVFSGGFGLDAVEEVCAGDPIASEDIFDLLGGLVDKSIVLKQHDVSGQEERFRMLDTVREFGRERLSALGEFHQIRVRHLDHFRGLAEQASTDYFSSREADWFQKVSTDRANVRAALELCLNEPEYAQNALRIATSLRTYWIAPGFILEGYQWLYKALSLDDEHTEDRARALWALSYIEILLGEVDAGLRTAAACRALADELGLSDLYTDLKLCESLAQFLRDDLPGALAIAEQAVVEGRKSATPAVTGEALFLATIMAVAQDDPRAEAYGSEAIALHDEHGAQLWKAFVLWVMALYWSRTGDQDRAVRNLREAIDIFVVLKHNLGLACCLDGLACVAVASGQPERAAELMGAAREIWRMGPARLPYHYVRQTAVDAAEQQTRNALGSVEFDNKLAQGTAMPLDTALTYAVESPAQTAPRHAVTLEATTLTRRETEIAEMVAQGLRNKEIAASLVISPRTVEAHVEHILGKLGFHSRAEIARWISRRDTSRSPD